MKKNIFIAFTLQQSAVSDFYLRLAIKLKNDFNVFIFSPKTDFALQNQTLGITINFWPSSRPTKFKDFIFLSKWILKCRPSIMISAFGAVNLFTLLGFMFLIKNRIAWVHTLSTQIKSKKFYDKRKSWVYKACSLIVANSNATKHDLITNFSVNQKKIRIVYNATLDPLFEPYDLDTRTIVFAGRIDPSKGVGILIKALGIVVKKYPEVKLKIVGAYLKGEVIKKYVKMVQELRLENNVTFIGWKSKKELLEIFGSSWFTVVPSLAEAFGYVVIESFSVKTPVIGSNTGGISEIIRDGKDGLLFSTGNYNDLANKIEMLLADSSLRDKLSKSCYQRFLDIFELDKASSNFANFLHQLSSS